MAMVCDGMSRLPGMYQSGQPMAGVHGALAWLNYGLVQQQPLRGYNRQGEQHKITAGGGSAQYKMRMRYDVASCTKFSKSCAPYRSQQKKGILGGEARNSGGVFLGQILGHKKGKIPRFARVLSVLAL